MTVAEPSPPGSRFVATGYRYPGSAPFADTELDSLIFRGRAREQEELLHSILGFDLLVIYGASGMGKSSVLNAGVFPELRSRGIWPVVIRLNDTNRKPFELIVDAIWTTADAEADIELMLHPQGDEASGNLWDLLSALEVWKGNDLQQVVLVFDQFEELFTLDWNEADQRAFIASLGEIVRRKRVAGGDIDLGSQALPPADVRIVVSLREDSLGELEALSTDIPQILHNLFRLRGLEADQARAAIIDPAGFDDGRFRSGRFSYTAEASDLLLTFLRTGDERGEKVIKPRVDPSQLQVVCQHIERVLVPSKLAAAPPLSSMLEITVEDLGGLDGLNEIVSDFYRRLVESFAGKDRANVRSLCEQGLISRSGRRLSLEEGEIEAEFSVSKQILDQLIDSRLLRAEQRVGSVYYELAHDTLVGPILLYRQHGGKSVDPKAEHRRAVLLDKWALGLALLSLPLLVFLVGGPAFAVALMALRTEPTDRGKRWRPRVAMGILLAWLAFSVLGTVGQASNGVPQTASDWIVPAVLLSQMGLGAVVGLAWPLRNGGPSDRPWVWVAGLVTVGSVAIGLVVILVQWLGSQPLDVTPTL